MKQSKKREKNNLLKEKYFYQIETEREKYLVKDKFLLFK